MHLLLIGTPYPLVLRNSRVNQRTFRLGISLFNEQGVDGLIYRPIPGRPCKIPPGVVADGILPVGDDSSLANQTHWTASKLCGWLREEKQMDLSYRTLFRYLHEHNYARRIPRRMSEPPVPEDWEKQREAFAERLVTLLESPAHDMFFGDEAGFEGDPRSLSKWVKRGSRTTQGYYGGHVRQNVIGAVNPATGQLVSLIVPHCDTEVFHLFLDVMAREVTERKGRIHRSKDSVSKDCTGCGVSNPICRQTVWRLAWVSMPRRMTLALLAAWDRFCSDMVAGNDVFMVKIS